MNCNEIRLLIHGYVDGELDIAGSMEVERHLEDCGSCAQALRIQKELSRSIRGAALRFDTPKGLEKRILAGVRRESRAESGSARMGWRRLLMPTPQTMAAMAASIVLLAAIGLTALRLIPASGGHGSLSDEVVSSHIRSLQASHLFDVASTNQHTVKPWFLGRLDYSPPVIDLADKGYTLTGGRLDYLDGRPVAALVYRHRLHVLNLFIWPARAADADSQTKYATSAVRGIHVVQWVHAGMTFYAVSDLNMAELKDFARDIAESPG